MGAIGAGISTSYSIINTVEYYQSGGKGYRVGVKAFVDGAMTVVAFLGPVGFVVSSGYFIMDAYTNGFEDF